MAVQVGSRLRDASVDPRADDLMPLREVDGHPGELKHAQVDEPEYLAAVDARRAEEPS